MQEIIGQDLGQVRVPIRARGTGGSSGYREGDSIASHQYIGVAHRDVSLCDISHLGWRSGRQKPMHIAAVLMATSKLMRLQGKVRHPEGGRGVTQETCDLPLTF